MGLQKLIKQAKKIVEFILCARNKRTYLFQMSVWKLSEVP